MAGGRRQVELRAGIHGRTKEQRSADGARGGKIGMYAHPKTHT
jgi:hypothetical protein